MSMSVVKFSAAGIAEIVLDPSASAGHVLDAMDLARALLEHGITAAKIIHSSEIKTKPATGAPATNVAHDEKEISDEAQA